MTTPSEPIPVYLEVGAKRVLAGALHWPGWCLSGRDEASALLALRQAGPRYAAILKGTRLGFKAPPTSQAVTIIERLKGNATTDFGAPDVPPTLDAQPLAAADLRRFERIIRASWAALGAAADAAEGRTLRRGPRGGGRARAGILAHVLEAQAGYLAALGWTFKPTAQLAPAAAMAELEAAMRAGLAAAARGDIPARGPRGGRRWTPRYFVRRSVWHLVDHAWELENRLEPE